MVNVRTIPCLHNSCKKSARWGVMTNSAPTACTRHKGEIFGGPVIDFKAICTVAGCSKLSRWGLDGKQPTHCRDHGPLQEELVLTVGMSCSKIKGRSPSYTAVRTPSSHVKTECAF
ncbi:unnamed protein product [Laminaria digitata]